MSQVDSFHLRKEGLEVPKPKTKRELSAHYKTTIERTRIWGKEAVWKAERLISMWNQNLHSFKSLLMLHASLIPRIRKVLTFLSR